MTNKEYRSFLSKANKRLSRLESANLHSYAYYTALDMIEKYYNPFITKKTDLKRFTQTNELDRERQVRDITRFLNMPTSTVRGARLANRKRDDTFKKRYLDKTGSKFTASMDDFYAFLSSTQFNSLSSRFSSSQVVDEVQLQLEEGRSLSEIQESFEQYLSQETTFEKYVRMAEDARNNGFNNRGRKK